MTPHDRWFAGILALAVVAMALEILATVLILTSGPGGCS